MSEMFLVTDKLTKKFGEETIAVDSVDLHIKKGSIYGLIGRNGAGKTTIMKMIAGMARPTSGSFTYTTEGDPYSDIGVLIEAPALIPSMSAYDNLKIKCLAYGISSKEYILDKLKLVGLDKAGKKKAGKFSLGMKQRLGIAMAMVGDPEFLILDEPINGLDPQGIIEIRNMLVDLNKEKGTTILISSHILEELSKVATDYAIIEKGKIIEESTREELMNKCKDKIVIKCSEQDEVEAVLKNLGYTEYERVSDKVIFVHERLSEIRELNKAIAQADILIESIGLEEPDLEEYFIKVTGLKGGEIK